VAVWIPKGIARNYRIALLIFEKISKKQRLWQELVSTVRRGWFLCWVFRLRLTRPFIIGHSKHCSFGKELFKIERLRSRLDVVDSLLVNRLDRRRLWLIRPLITGE